MKPLLYSILPRPPHATRDGLAIRNYHLLEALAARFRVRAFSLTDPSRKYGGQIPEGVEMESVAQAPRARRRAGAAAASLLFGGAYSERLYRSLPLERRLAELAAHESPRWIVAHSYHVAAAGLSAGAPLWIDFHNLDSEIWDRTAQSASSLLVRSFARVQAPRVLRLERSLAKAAAGLSCVSRRDAEALRFRGASANPRIVPNGVDLSRYAFRRGPPEGELVLFVGDLSWPPNADAVAWFAREIWPRIRTLRPEARAEILGRSAPGAWSAWPPRISSSRENPPTHARTGRAPPSPSSPCDPEGEPG